MGNRTTRRKLLFWAAGFSLSLVTFFLMVATWQFLASSAVKMQLDAWSRSLFQASQAASGPDWGFKQAELDPGFSVAGEVRVSSSEMLQEQALQPFISPENPEAAAPPAPWLGSLPTSGLEEDILLAQNQTAQGASGVGAANEGDRLRELYMETIKRNAPPYPEGSLSIPSIDLEVELSHVLVRDGKWDIAELDDRVGWLQTTGSHPGDDLAMAFIGHVTLPPPGGPGPFYYLHRLKKGDEIYYRSSGSVYVYKIDQRRSITPSEVSRLYQWDGDRLILVTCTSWNPVSRKFERRFLLEGSLDRVEMELGQLPNSTVYLP